METDGRCPGATSVMLVIIPSRQVESVVDLGNKFPVHEILGLQDLHAHEMKVRGDHVILVAMADHIRI